MPKNFVCSGSGDADVSGNYIEISIDPNVLNNFSNEDGMSAFLSSQSCSEEFKLLKAELLQEVLLIIEMCLTKKQKEVMKMTFVDGMTQNEIASELGKHQTTIHKLLYGNLDYNNKRRRYGGAMKKIRKMCANSKKIQEILTKMKQQVE